MSFASLGNHKNSSIIFVKELSSTFLSILVNRLRKALIIDNINVSVVDRFCTPQIKHHAN